MAAETQAVWQHARVVDVATVAVGIQQLVLGVENPRPAAPGSHVDVVVRSDGRESTRSYSVVGAAQGGGELTIGVRLATNSRGGSRFMHSLRPGDELRMTQPLQNFPLRIGAPRYVLLAGGIGITALVGAARALKRLDSQYRLVYLGRSRSQMAYVDQLAEVHGESLQLHVDDESSGLDVAAFVDEIADAGPTELYMCGPIRLMDAVRRRWRERCLSPADLRYETFGNSGWFDAEEFVVEVPRLGIVTTVGSGQTLLEALELAGVGVISDCRKGECGLCQVRVLGVDGAVDHRDVFFSEAQRRTSSKMCVCVSRAALNAEVAADEPRRRGVATVGGAGGRASLTIDVP